MSIIIHRLDKNYYKVRCKTMQLDEKVIEDVLYYNCVDKYKLVIESELDYAMDQFASTTHNTAHFSINGNFIFSEYTKELK